MYSLPNTRFFDFTNITQNVFWLTVGWTIPYVWKKINVPLKSKNLWYDLKALKYQILGNYEYWRISQKCGDDMHEMTKVHLKYLTKQLLAEVKNKLTKEQRLILSLIIHTAYPKELLLKNFGKTKLDIRNELNVEKFFQTVFA